jgi:protein-serine/threonine kinase
MTMNFSGSPWTSAQSSDTNYARVKKGWDEWLQNHPDGQIKDEADGAPKCGPAFNKIDPPALRRLLLKMTHPNPDMRITIRNVVTSGYVKGIECCSPESYEDPKCCVNAAKSSKNLSKLVVQKKHNHIPPKDDRKAHNKALQVFQHRFDMGDGWS